MSKSDENTNELESYGVWVKNSSEQPEDITNKENIENSTDSLDLPEFDDTDFSDMFKNDSDFEAPKVSDEPEAGDDSFSDDDSTLTADELQNISNTTEVSDDIDDSALFANGEELSNENGTEEVVLHEFPEDNDIQVEEEPEEEISTEDIFTQASEEAFGDLNLDEAAPSDSIPDPEESVEDTFESEPAVSEEEVSAPVEDSSDKISFEDAGIESFESSTPLSDEIEIKTEDGNSDLEFEEISFDSIDEPAEEKPEEKKPSLAPGEEEISLDDFLEDGFSDDSVASGNNGYEPGKGPDAKPAAAAPASEGTEDISLDDFIDTSDFGVDVQETEISAPTEEVSDEPPLDMELSFDDSADTIETEDNKIETDFSDFTADDSEDVDTESFEETTVTEEEPYQADTSNVSTEEVDLSDFGIDSDAEETPVTQNVEEKKAADAVVDYDLSIGDEDTLTSAPVINEIKTSEDETQEAPVESVQTPEPAPAAAPDPTTTSLLQQIMAELTGLKSDITRLKGEIDEVKNSPFTPAPQSAGAVHTETNDNPAAVSEENFEMPEVEINEEPVIEETSVDIEEPSIPENTEETVAADFDEPVFEETSVEEPVIEETEVSFDEPAADETVIEETPVTFDEPSVETEETVEEPTFEPEIEEPVIEETPVEETTEEQVFDETPVSFEEPVIEEPVIEEPVIEDFTAPETTEETPVTDEITEEPVFEEETEISEPVSDSSSGFFDDDGDDTIALSEDELTQIPLDTEITDVEAEAPQIEEPVQEEELPQEEESSGFFTDDGDDTIALSGDELTNIMNTTEITEPEVSEEPVIEDDISVVENEPSPEEEVSVSESEVSFDESPIEEHDSDLNFDFEDKNLEEPDIENISFDEIEDDSSDLPDEISIPKAEDDTASEDSILVESNSSDFMESVSEGTSPETEEVTEVSEEAEPAAEQEENFNFDNPDTLFDEYFATAESLCDELDNIAAPAETETVVEPVPAETPIEETPAAEAPSFEESFEENAEQEVPTVDQISATFADEPAADDSFMTVDELADTGAAEPEAQKEDDIPTVDKLLSQKEPEAQIDTEFAEVDNLDTNISKANIDYLNEDKENPALNKAATDSNEDLKRDIKSVLLYMDQLLENLPEEKIMEFAKSDEFVTYKKLFSDLGLS